LLGNCEVPPVMVRAVGRRRLALLTVATGCLVAGLAAFNWGLVRDHVEAWRFQATRETETVVPGAIRGWPFSELAFCAKRPVVFVPHESRSYKKDYYQALSDDPSVFERHVIKNIGCDSLLGELRRVGYRILDQRLPRRAYVVVRYPNLPRAF
jgi:hypothetical protein